MDLYGYNRAETILEVVLTFYILPDINHAVKY